METWRRQRESLARFGMRALHSADLQAILDEACSSAAQGVDAQIGKVLKRLPGEGELLLRASVGIPPEIARPGTTRLPGHSESAAGFALMTGEPVLSHIPTETRFRVSELVRRCKICYSANVVIQFSDERYGTLEVDRLDERPFTEDDVHFLQIYANLVGAAVLRHRTASQIDLLARERELLLRELQHRVRNDLQVISTLLSLEQREAIGLEAKARLDKIRAGVESLRLAHQHLSAERPVGRVNLSEYLRALCLGRFQMQGIDPEGPIRLELALSEVVIDQDRAVRIGLIVNEFLTNSMKYAFPVGTGVIRVAAEAWSEGRVRIVLADNGIGFPDSAAQPGNGMGMQLSRLLAQSIDAEIAWSSDNGVELTITLPATRTS